MISEQVCKKTIILQSVKKQHKCDRSHIENISPLSECSRRRFIRTQLSGL